MPEIAEVESARRLVASECIGRVIEDVICHEQGGGPRDSLFDEIVIRAASASEFKAALIGRTLVEASRVRAHT